MIAAKHLLFSKPLSLFSPLLKQTFKKDTHTIFDRIISKEIPSTIVFEDDKCLAFKDISPQAPFHVVLIPKFKDGLTQLQKAEERHTAILGHLLLKVADIAKQNNLEEGYRVVINDGKIGGQTVYHLHLHILGGTQMGWPPGVLGKEEIFKHGRD